MCIMCLTHIKHSIKSHHLSHPTTIIVNFIVDVIILLYWV
jgi:hypothetical protein